MATDRAGKAGGRRLKAPDIDNVQSQDTVVTETTHSGPRRVAAIQDALLVKAKGETTARRSATTV
jgi:hypothetical protein